MRRALRQHLATILVAMVTAAVTAGGPALAAAVQQAMNADTVDSRHAVGAGASRTKRAGKLVATNDVGRLPDDIIAKAPNADRLDGVNSNRYARHGLVRVSAGSASWQPMSTDADLVLDGRSHKLLAHRTTAGQGLLSAAITLPSAVNGRRLSVRSVKYCYSTNPGVTINLAEATVWRGTGTNADVKAIATDADGAVRTDEACRSLTFDSPPALAGTDHLSFDIQGNWTQPSAKLELGSVTVKLATTGKLVR